MHETEEFIKKKNILTISWKSEKEILFNKLIQYIINFISIEKIC